MSIGWAHADAKELGKLRASMERHERHAERSSLALRDLADAHMIMASRVLQEEGDIDPLDYPQSDS